MNSLQTNRDVFSLLKDSSISFKDVQLTINKIEEVTGITSNSTFKAKIKKFCHKLQMKWSEAFRMESRFIIKNKNWLDGKFQIPLELIVKKKYQFI